MASKGVGYTFEVYKCPGNFYSNSFFTYLELFRSYKNGLNVFEGPVSEWPAKILEIFSVIESKELEKKNELRKKAEKEAKKGKK